METKRWSRPFSCLIAVSWSTDDRGRRWALVDFLTKDAALIEAEANGRPRSIEFKVESNCERDSRGFLRPKDGVYRIRGEEWAAETTYGHAAMSDYDDGFDVYEVEPVALPVVHGCGGYAMPFAAIRGYGA